VSVPEALSIRLRTGTAASLIRDVHITSEVDDLVFGSTSPGGFDTCTMSLHRPLSITPAEVEQFGRVYVYDTRNRSTVWEGRLQDPGRSAGSDGEVYQLAAIGGVAHLQDDTRQLYYIDTDPGRWDSIDVTTAAATPPLTPAPAAPPSTGSSTRAPAPAPGPTAATSPSCGSTTPAPPARCPPTRGGCSSPTCPSGRCWSTSRAPN
jgi:hypothetical protein